MLLRCGHSRQRSFRHLERCHLVGRCRAAVLCLYLRTLEPHQLLHDQGSQSLLDVVITKAFKRVTSAKAVGIWRRHRAAKHSGHIRLDQSLIF